MTSIRRQLLFWLLVGLSLALAVAAVGTYFRARVEANELFDHQLQAMVASLADAPFTAAPVEGAGNGAGDDALVVQIWDSNGVRLYLSQPQRELPQHARIGFNDVHTDDGDWRVFSALSGNQVIQVAQPMRARRALAARRACRDRRRSAGSAGGFEARARACDAALGAVADARARGARRGGERLRARGPGWGGARSDPDARAARLGQVDRSGAGRVTCR